MFKMTGSQKKSTAAVVLSGESDGWVIAIYENERPLQGFSGGVDWFFHGQLSQFLKKEFITGKPGECAYVPLEKNERVYHLILVGAGRAPAPGERHALPSASQKVLEKNLESLAGKTFAYSRDDLGGTLLPKKVRAFA